MEAQESKETPELFTVEQVDEIVQHQVQLAIKNMQQSFQFLQHKVATLRGIIECNGYPQDLKEDAIEILRHIIKPTPLQFSKEVNDGEEKSE